MQFNDHTREVKEFKNNYFSPGVHKVQIAGITLDHTQTDKEFIEVNVLGSEGEEDAARVWFTTDKAANYSFNVLRAIFIHNTPETKRDEARALFDKVEDTVALSKMLQSLLGKECWFTVYPSADRTYTDPQGRVKPSFDKNVLGYEPKLDVSRLPKDANGIADLDKVNQVMPGAQEVPFASSGDAAGSVPASDAWSK